MELSTSEMGHLSVQQVTRDVKELHVMYFQETLAVVLLSNLLSPRSHQCLPPVKPI